MNRRVVSIVLLGLLFVGAIAAVGAYEYRVGLARGLAVSGQQLPAAGPNGWPAWPYPYWGFHPFGFVFPLLFVFLIFALARRLFWWGRPASWSRGSWRHDRRAQFDEWHRKAHESMASGGGESR